jgi:hypothetical protein
MYRDYQIVVSSNKDPGFFGLEADYRFDGLL